jgi:hypothetical protein
MEYRAFDASSRARGTRAAHALSYLDGFLFWSNRELESKSQRAEVRENRRFDFDFVRDDVDRGLKLHVACGWNTREGRFEDLKGRKAIGSFGVFRATPKQPASANSV